MKAAHPHLRGTSDAVPIPPVPARGRGGADHHKLQVASHPLYSTMAASPWSKKNHTKSHQAINPKISTLPPASPLLLHLPAIYHHSKKK